eukprot:GHVR01114309.1.p1 GENE.GHVR01114309.1~~GHVR01114309.1.p1  ORF type:complete len:512 (-),score=141.95 GHVR01114309.1:62-1597(-)
MYGCGEDVFAETLKAAWLGLQTHRCIGPGTNYIPTVHVRDLARVIKSIPVSNNNNNIIAVDTSYETQKSLLQGIIRSISIDTPIESISPEQALLSESGSIMTIDARFVPSGLMGEGFQWWCKEGLVGGVLKVADEFCKWRCLRPLKVVLIGPPCVGKSTHALTISNHYNIPHMKIADIINSSLGGTDEFSINVRSKLSEAEELIKGKKGETARLDNETIGAIVNKHLSTNICKYRGYVLDGYPRNFKEAETSFLKKKEVLDGEEGEEGEGVGEGDVSHMVIDTNVAPEFVISLQASLDYCKKNCMNIPQTEVEGTHNTEDGFKRRYARWQSQNEQPGGPPAAVVFFTENKIETLTLDVQNRTIENVYDSSRIYIERRGRPNNYLTTENDIAKAARNQLKHDEENEKILLQEQLQLEEEFEDEQRKRRENEEVERMKLIVDYESKLVETHSKPLQSYLKTFVVPSLTEGLIEICKVLPEDPVDYLAEFLFTRASQLQETNTDPSAFMQTIHT